MSRPVNFAVKVENGDIEQALKRFKKLYLTGGFSRLIRSQTSYVQPSAARRLNHRAAVRRTKRYAARGRAIDARMEAGGW